MDDQAFPSKVSDDTSTDGTQNKIDGALDKLPDDLEKIIEPPPVKPAGDFNQAFAKAGANPVSTPTLPPSPVPPQPASSPPTPPPLVDDVKSRSDVTDRGSSAEPGLEMPEVKKEESGSIKPPKRKIGKAVKVIGGVLMVALVVGGGLFGRNMLQEKQSVESQASCTPSIKGKTVYECTAEGKVKVSQMSDDAFQGFLQKADENEGEEGWNGNSYTGTTQTVNQGETLDTETANSEIKEVIKEAEEEFESWKSPVGTYTPKSTSHNDCPDNWCGDCGGFCGDGGATGCGELAIKYCGYRIVGQGDLSALSESDVIIYLCPPGHDSTVCLENRGGATLAQVLAGDYCGTVQVDSASSGEYVFYAQSSKGCSHAGTPDEPNGGPDPSPPPSTPPSSSYSCASLAGDGVYALNSTETFTCTAAFSAVNPVAFFRYNVDGGTYTTSSAVTLTGSSATYDVTVDEYGDWEVQCRVCTDSGATDCTTWGNAN